MLYLAICLKCKLDIVAICTFENTHSFDLLDGKRRYLLLLVANKAQAANATAICEGDMFPIGVKLPSGLFVLYRTIVVLKPGIPLLPWFLDLTVLIEPLNGEPRTISSRLAGLGIERRGKEVFLSK